ncbi:hypothetical protein EXIGLDRAFT_452948 [Exidia glandulosa HHB12029]|uniref:Gti1/Pac2 family-domain-containing protein n=1 Tax=Exidia glandulosa HHB12029 TaxID=1314781 RepID=A0A166AWY8_EXIGL|nr:hypothetical protein EXIGLDRAFT_452948 [Exidia glandulosa HHB12029]
MVRARDVSGGSQQPEVFRAFIRSTYDALLMFEAALSGRIPRVTRRFNYNEKRDDIKSGSTYVFGEEEAEIKRWTDGLTWSPSRINKNFLIYRERYAPDEPRPEIQPRREYENWLVGTLTTADIKPDGLVKKTIGLTIEGLNYHLVSYYDPEEVLNGSLQRPSRMPQFQNMCIRDSILDCRMLRDPLKCEIGPLGQRIAIPDEEGSSGPVSRNPTPPSDSPSPPPTGLQPQFFAVSSSETSPPSFTAAFPQDMRLVSAEGLEIVPVSSPIPLNTLEFYPDGFGNVSLAPSSSLTRRRSTRSGSNRYAPYAMRGRNSAPEAGMHAQQQQQHYMHMPLHPSVLRPAPQSGSQHQQQQQQQQHMDEAATQRHHSSPPPMQVQPLEPSALIRTRSAPAPLELIPPPLLASSGYPEPLSATLSEFEDPYYYGPITPQSVGGFDYFDLGMPPSDMKFGGVEIGPGMGLQHELVLPGSHDDMSQYLIQGGWEGELA